MAQLAHVARPGVGQQQLPSACVDGADVLAVLGVEALDEVLRQNQDVVASFSEWREVEDDHGEPKVEIPAELLAARMRTSIRRSRTPPTRRTVRSSTALRSFPWSASSRSPTSSRKRNPPSAASHKPILDSLASVKAPRSWPKSSA